MNVEFSELSTPSGVELVTIPVGEYGIKLK
jgi:hypothetical protein